ncbi:orotate phosphoribosyltransferase [Thalassoroseus pseudoceratinae]|uniref:orotate phosphoribosyltransferase n=1 Tax=Thalassoroseus pseudoceratinae TaxID=2713176 RepID=UPI00197F9553|nr:orotate phosphoribosyltransferase [Thalassoroseus pseudoceratinae]
MSGYNRDQLIEAFKNQALKFGEFTLASGQKSNYYLDGKQVTLEAHGLRLVAEGLLDLLADVKYDAIGGMSIGADPIIGAVIAMASVRGRDLKGFLVRKEAKGHGTKRYVEGPVTPGERVVIVDDVVTTGGSAMISVERIQEFGCDVVQVVGVVDRLQGGAATFAGAELPYRALLDVTDLDVPLGDS